MSGYRELLERAGVIGRGFEYREIVSASPRKQEPPDRLQANIVPALHAAIDLRERMIKIGASGLNIAAAYRPKGGVKLSAHKWNRALDLDLLDGDQALDCTPHSLAEWFLIQAAELFAEYKARGVDIGIGTYGPAGCLWTRRVHIDIGHSATTRARPGTWTIHRGYQAPAVITYLEQQDQAQDLFGPS